MSGLYPPINRPKPVCSGLWIVDGPLIRFGLKWVKFAFPTRMTIVDVGGGELLLHSPTAWSPDLAAALSSIGRPRWLVGPNRLHHWWIPQWKRVFPEAEVHLAPHIESEADGRIDFPYHPIDARRPFPWDERLETLLVTGRYMTEAVLFDRPTRTLILTDLIENFEPEKLGSPIVRLIAKVGGVLDPHGSMPRDMRLSFRGRREALKAAVETMIAWDPERIILAHGRWYEADGSKELRRAFAWLLD